MGGSAKMYRQYLFKIKIEHNGLSTLVKFAEQQREPYKFTANGFLNSIGPL
jgi:capsule polysaccharide export protein KpsC/LpsZ